MPNRIDPLIRKVDEISKKLDDLVLKLDIEKEEELDFEILHGHKIRKIAEEVFERLKPKPRTSTRRTTTAKKTTGTSRSTDKKEEEKDV